MGPTQELSVAHITYRRNHSPKVQLLEKGLKESSATVFMSYLRQSIYGET